MIKFTIKYILRKIFYFIAQKLTPIANIEKDLTIMILINDDMVSAKVDDLTFKEFDKSYDKLIEVLFLK